MDLSGYTLATLHQDTEFVLCRGHGRGAVVAPSRNNGSPICARRVIAPIVCFEYDQSPIVTARRRQLWRISLGSSCLVRGRDDD